MAKSETLPQPKKKNGVAQRSDCLLTPEIATALAEIVKQGGKLFTTDQWAKNEPIVITVGETSTKVHPRTYNNWVTRENLVPGTNLTLKQLMANARELRRQLRHEQERKELIRKAQEGLKALQALPIGTKTTLIRQKFRFTKGEKVKTGEEIEEQVRDIDPQLVSIKHRGNEFVLERLDPEYAAKKETKNTTVMLSLADLRKAKEEKEGKKADYEV